MRLVETLLAPPCSSIGHELQLESKVLDFILFPQNLLIAVRVSQKTRLLLSLWLLLCYIFNVSHNNSNKRYQEREKSSEAAKTPPIEAEAHRAILIELHRLIYISANLYLKPPKRLAATSGTVTLA